MDNNLDLSKFLWKKRIILIKNNQNNLAYIQRELGKYQKELVKYKIEYFILNHHFSNNIVLIGLDGLVKHQSNKINLKKIFDLISKMPLANY